MYFSTRHCKSNRANCTDGSKACKPLLVLLEFQRLFFFSGAGKTTLLDFLANQTSSLKVTGTVRLNGRKITKSELGNVAAYVHQEDLFIGTLKVSEHLRFQVI